jgi:hypothetical protein
LSVPIRFLSERAIYDEKSDTIRVPAVDGNKLVVFAITRTAIMNTLWNGDVSVVGLIDMYRRHCQAFHTLARHKYRSRRTEPDGTVLVGDGDMPVLGGPRNRPRVRALN